MIYALGSALPVFTMSLVKSPLIALANSDIQDFSIVMLTKTLGSLVGAPLMTVLWVHAIKLGGIGLGLPYFVSAVSIPQCAYLKLIVVQCIYLMAAYVVTRLKLHCLGLSLCACHRDLPSLGDCSGDCSGDSSCLACLDLACQNR
jgi:hypothetical protein